MVFNYRACQAADVTLMKYSVQNNSKSFYWESIWFLHLVVVDDVKCTECPHMLNQQSQTLLQVVHIADLCIWCRTQTNMVLYNVYRLYTDLRMIIVSHVSYLSNFCFVLFVWKMLIPDESFTRCSLQVLIFFINNKPRTSVVFSMDCRWIFKLSCVFCTLCSFRYSLAALLNY